MHIQSCPLHTIQKGHNHKLYNTARNTSAVAMGYQYMQVHTVCTYNSGSCVLVWVARPSRGTPWPVKEQMGSSNND